MWTTEEKILAGVSVVSTSVGLTVGYALARRNLRTKYEALAEQEIAEAKVFYARLQKPARVEDVKVSVEVEDNMTEQLEDLKEAVQGLDYGSLASSEDDQRQAVDSIHNHNGDEDSGMSVFTESAAYTDEMTEEDQAERSNREANELPYIISMEEFMQGEKDYMQVTLTYYEKDDVLSDDKDVPVPDSDGVVGDDNLTKFGFLSKDRNIVYVRNDRNEMDFEIIRHQGSFAETVHGILEHADRPGRGRVRKFRGLHDE